MSYAYMANQNILCILNNNSHHISVVNILYAQDRSNTQSAKLKAYTHKWSIMTNRNRKRNTKNHKQSLLRKATGLTSQNSGSFIKFH